MASSVRVGLSALLGAEPALDALAVLLCDQPALSAALLRRLFEAQRATGRIASARYGGRNGAPAVFGRVHFSALGRLTGDQGARAILNRHSADVTPVDLPELGIDLDTPADFKRWAAGGS
jgi:CTP:molybdopterin cytidylyltransferase MocA